METRSLVVEATAWPERVSDLAELARRAVSNAPVELTITFALDLVRLAASADSATYWDLPDPDHIRLAIARGWPGAIDGTVYPIAPDSQAAYALADDRVVVVDQLADTRFVPSRLVAAMGYATTMTRRIGMATAPRGLISLHSSDRREFGDDIAALVETAAGIVTLALEFHRSQEDLRFRAEHDWLTGLANRARLVDVLDSIVGRVPAAAVLLIDLDGFKAINDTSGHHAGDAVLQRVSRRLLENSRAGDIVGRLGGDELVVIAPDCPMHVAPQLAERILGSVEQLITVDDETFSISASVGVADASTFMTGEAVLQAADAAMYAAKLSGRGRVHVAASLRPTACTAGRRQRATDPPTTTSPFTVADIDAAIARTATVFQPIVTADGHHVVGVEALARGPAGTVFEHPADLFALAERFSRVAELDVAAKRAAFAAGVPASLQLFINVDPAVLESDQHRHALIEAWRSSGHRGEVVVEITERSLTASPGRLLRAIAGCRDVGWRIALDDVGARAESLTALRLVRPDIVKLDMSLVDGRNVAHAASVAVAVATHRSQRPLVVIAEGVETAEHEAVALDLGATLLQGFRFGRPGPIGAVLGRGARPAGAAFGIETTGPVRRVARKRHLLAVTRVVEAMARGPEAIVLAALQSSVYYSPRTRSQYAALARRCGMAGVIGRGVAPGVVRGVHHASLGDDDPLAREWIVVVLGDQGGIALVAEDLGDEGVADLDRRFEYHVTRQADDVEAVAERLLSRF
jgi:diguanylate cyclase (GGDEF)-like protein